MGCVRWRPAAETVKPLFKKTVTQQELRETEFPTTGIPGESAPIGLETPILR
jgi:hypothetical protein